WFEDYPVNYNAETVNRYYLKQPNYSIAGSIRYRILERTNIGYMYYGSFSSAIGDGNLDEILFAFSGCDGIIIDVRSNGGGVITNVEKIASRFIKNEIVSGYIRHKVSPEHNHFSDFYPIVIKPADSKRIKYCGPIAVLTNRSCFSATNDFVSVMKQLPQVAVIGDRTGGGSGLPFSSSLPNGWSLRFSASPIVNALKEEIEFGIDPTVKVNLTATTETDNIIDAAVSWIKSHYVK
ncbi:MAG: S41 family peptidase, partial [Bacteroidales bacterium]